ncbi:hypothetical protein [Kribbella sp. NPDC048928]|uniref:hypothetical protein n=1 Tax=Kribbella sp. NPDC048928 TaxID=3364111 RepID=UPI0037193D8D
MCGPTNLTCHVVAGVQSVATNWFDNFNRMSTEFFSTALNSLATFWVKPHTPVALATPSGDGSWTDSKTVAFVHSQTFALTAAIFTLAIVVAGIRMAWEQRAKPLQDLLKAMLTFVVVCGAGTAVVQLLIAWSDDFAVNVVNSAIGGNSFASMMTKMVTAQTEHNSGQEFQSRMMFMVLAQLATFASLIQIVLMLIRSAMLVLLGSTLPLAAAATNTEVGKAWLKKYCAWTLGFVAYKPAAALIYAAAIKLKNENMLSGDNSGVMQSLTALMMMMLAILAMPALLRLAVPATAAVAGGSSGMGSAGPDMGSLATGALNVGPSSSRSGGASGGGMSGGGASGGGASGAASTGAKAAGASAALGPVGVAASAARKAAGTFAGAAAHSAGEAGGGPGGSSGGGGRSGRGPMSSGGKRTQPAAPSSNPQPKVPVGAGSSGTTGPTGAGG